MSDNPIHPEIAVDRHEETVTTQQPGFSAVERTTRDFASERRQSANQMVRIVWAGLALLEILLGLRVLLILMGANMENGFARFIQAVTFIPTAPFSSLTPAWTAGGSSLEVSTLIAMAIYWLAAWLIVRAIPIMMDRQSKGTVTRTTSERPRDASGTDRTIETTRRG
ncbi:MAG TPA: YggT family protein [Anaerolineales bacterium]|nr:YggT family protein [Anaerolineales bacterium]